jgi:hypothetical protein
MAKPTDPQPAATRSSAGLRDALFDELDAIRSGKSNPTRANAVAKLAAGIVETVRMELDVARYANGLATSARAVQQHNGLPQPLELGAA